VDGHVNILRFHHSAFCIRAFSVGRGTVWN